MIANDRVLLVVVLTLLWLSGFGQEKIYHYSFRKHQPYFYSAFALWAGSRINAWETPAEVLDEFAEIDVSRLWHLDRKTVGQNSRKADRLSDATLYLSIASPFVITLVSKAARRESLSIVLMGLQGYFMESGLNQFCKTLGERPRPYIYDRGRDVLDQTISKSSTASFYSGHTSSTAYFSFFAAKVFQDLNPQSKWNKFIWMAAIALPATTGYLRVRAGKHFPTDVITGFIIGGGIGLLTPSMFHNQRIGIAVSSNGINLGLKL